MPASAGPLIVEICWAVDTRADAAAMRPGGMTFGSSANWAGVSNARPRPNSAIIA